MLIDIWLCCKKATISKDKQELSAGNEEIKELSGEDSAAQINLPRGIIATTGSTFSRSLSDPPAFPSRQTPMTRKPKRAATLPTNLSPRRGDLKLSAEVQGELRAFVKRKPTQRLTRLSLVDVLQDEYVSEEVLQKTFEDNASCYAYGLMSEDQQHGDERELQMSVGNCFPGEMRPIISCQRGRKGKKSMTPNQDNYSLTYFKNGYTLVCAFDGHGGDGHFVATRTVQTVPYFLMKSEHFPKDIPAALIESFEKAHADVVAKGMSEDWDIMGSGSCAVVALYKDNIIWTANAGDSRCIVSTSEGRILHETDDHKPDTPAEQARIEASGGHVVTKIYSDGFVSKRVYIKGQDFPGLAMARTLGDECAKDIGVIASPEVKMLQVDLADKPFIVIGSDGIWDFMSSAVVAEGCADTIKRDGHEQAVKLLQKEAKDRWGEEEEDYVDDITSILIQLS